MAAKGTLLQVFNHIAFPPNLPGKSDAQSEDVERDLMFRLLDASKFLKNTCHEDLLPAWQMIENSLKTCYFVNEDGVCNRAALLKAFKKLGPERSIILRVREQNAGLLIRQPQDDESNIIFEAFEISASAEKTLATQGALQWDFPGMAVSIPSVEFDNSLFRESLATFLENASVERLDEFAAKARKAGTEISEERDTVNPAVITQFLMTLLETIGKRVYLPVLQKRVKDDVCWDNAKLPWRRSPLWLVLRVCVQRMLYLRLGSNLGRVQYKFFMCSLLAKLLTDCTSELSGERCNFLKAKLCRRLAKLDVEKIHSTAEVQAAYKDGFKVIGILCDKAIQDVTTAIEDEWAKWKKNFQRKVPQLPSHASPNDFRLTLPNSTAYFKEILQLPQARQYRTKDVDPRFLSEITAKNTTKQFAALTRKYSMLANEESAIKSEVHDIPSKKSEIEEKCITTASRITDYIGTVADAYDGNPEQFSTFILNIFEMWMDMDKCATAAYPLLRDYHPWFNPELLDVLLLSNVTDFKRLQAIQLYIHSRCTQAQQVKMTIFTDPCSGCFADRYFDLPEATAQRKLQKRIEDASSVFKDDKKLELKRVNKTFEDLTEKLRQSACTQLRNLDGTHDIRGCSHCFYLRSRRRLEITVHEDFLPMQSQYTIQKRAVIFELAIPKSFSAYREATWSIMNRLCPTVEPSVGNKPEVLLSEYSQLTQYKTNVKHACFSLASHTKSFLGTHYHWKRLPAAEDDVLLPHGLKYSYYDSKRKFWSKSFSEQLSFAHHFTLNIPKEFPFSTLYASSVFAVDCPGPSSYEVIASVRDCPSELTVHEYTSHQSLISGRSRRWLSILCELGSSNIDFSLQDTMALFHHLALQAGPRLESEYRRIVHVVFNDTAFCNRLIEQIRRHIETIATNWRETTYMETLLTLTLQLCSLCHVDSRIESFNLLHRIRVVTLDWITLLRNETKNSLEVDHSERAARYCFLSSLLCRRTFTPWVGSQSPLDARSLLCFFEASLAMQESLVVDLSKFSRATRNMLVRDIKMTARLSSLLRDSVIEHPSSLEMAINTFWPDADNIRREFGDWKLLQSPYENWLTSKIHATEHTVPQVVHFHLLEGHLVIDGQTIGKLPADIRDSEILKEVFGNQRLFAFPSNLPGMEYVLANRGDGHQIHLGYRDKQLVIQARAFDSILELVPRHVFGNGPDFDLPFTLISDCIHWVDLRSGILEVRRKPHIWKRRDGNWNLNLRTRNAQRRTSLLIDPYSQVARSVAQVFLHFEHACRLTVFQPLKGKLSVELKRMDLDFFVNKWGLLECRQLGAVIDQNQDAGTLYGLQSMLVLRDVRDRSQRSIITPLGRIIYQRYQSHVLAWIENKGTYARYAIDDVLQRLHCPAEPRLVYAKAQLHAFTSHFLPDPLTGRTGTEEALCCLQSGYCQPWMPLAGDLIDILMSISSLTPRREYYPKDRRCQQFVHWDPQLTTSIQHDSFQVVVNTIIKKSHRLSLFEAEGTFPTIHEHPNVTHLRDRALWRRSIYQRPGILSEEPTRPQDLAYAPQDGWSNSKRTSNVRELVTLLRKRPSSIHTTRDLTGLLEKWSSISGYANPFGLHDLGECIAASLPEQWGPLINLCRDAKKEDAFQLMFHLGAVAFQDGINMTAMRVIVSFFLIEELKGLTYPEHSFFVHFKANEEPTVEKLLPIVKGSCQVYEAPVIPKKKKSKISNENSRVGCNPSLESECAEFVEILMRQWPCAEPSVEGFVPKYLDVTQAVEAIRPEWNRLYQNMQLYYHIQRVQTILNQHYKAENHVVEPPIPPDSVLRETLERRPGGIYSNPDLAKELLGKDALNSIGYADVMQGSSKHSESTNLSRADAATPNMQVSDSVEIVELEKLVNKLAGSDCSVRARYAQDLEQSIAALKIIRKAPGTASSLGLNVHDLVKFGDIKAARKAVDTYFFSIIKSLSKNDKRLFWLQKGNLWPCLTPTTILQQLRSKSQHRFGLGMKELFISYGLEITKLQKLLRLKRAFLKGDESRVNQEHKDRGHVNWKPIDYPDWLLLEIDANMQIREDQVTVALEMISPTSGSNSVLQMNMGQGKTSVIMPMVATVLADGEMLNRLLVPKALLSQAAQILQSRLGGLLGREITHIPFSRRTRTTVPLIQEYRNLHEDMIRMSGIIFGIPEHILSFKLSGLQRLCDSKINEAVEMIETQHWMNRVCRDVLDECDFTLAVKTQLIYPGGAQLAVDGHPNRWEVAMIILDLVARHLPDLARDYPQSIDIAERSSTGFPVAYLLRKDVEGALVSKIVDDIFNGFTSILPLRDCTERVKQAIRTFISQEKIEEPVSKRISRLFPDSPNSRKNVYLLRGLLVHGILILCLKKRWNVQYGLHHRRDPIAVPFHAKGVPSDQAEWGHPDVAILFTCLSFYYEGLSQKQLKRSLEAVLKSDHPATEYDRWTHSSNTLPEALRHWNIITVDDEGQVAEIWRHLRFTPIVINYFLSNFVFPLHAKQFATKLQASGWDVLLYNDTHTLAPNDMSMRPGITTGFSGTNDNRRLLPLTITQCDLPGLSHTNAEVLTYLLQPRNRGYHVASDRDGRRLSEANLLKSLKTSRVRILIDAGAFIMEMDNWTVAKDWLQEDFEAQGAVYFAEDNKPWVLYRNLKRVPLLATPFADDMRNCLVYLDEAHTRGTDLKLPTDAKGALTLGLGQTKDHTVQAAMRLRQLGTTQAVTFVAPPEVHQSILDVCKKNTNDPIDSSDVITWLLDQTCASNRDLQSLYFCQGTDFCRRMQAAATYRKFLSNSSHRKAYLDILQQPEQQTLQQLYEPRTNNATSLSESVGLAPNGRVAILLQELEQRREETQTYDTIITSALEEVEQEREVAYEIEEEREVQRPRRPRALKFPGLHPSILNFAQGGCLVFDCVIKASTMLESSQLGSKYNIQGSSLLPHLYLSTEFTRTIKLKKDEKQDPYTRPVNWILFNNVTDTAVIIIPEEAEALIPIMRNSVGSDVHLILYAAPVTRKMLHFNNLDYYALPSLPRGWIPPSWLRFEVGLLAGRLYFEFSEYQGLLDRLYAISEESDEDSSSPNAWAVAKSRLAFLQEWLVIRRQGQDITHTPMGYVCQDWPLHSDHPFFSSSTIKANDSGNEHGLGSLRYSSRDEEEYYTSDDGDEMEMVDDSEGDFDHDDEVD